MAKITFSACVLALLISASRSNADTTVYVITDLGTTIAPVSINNKGQVVGYRDTAAGHREAILYQGGTVTGLGTFGGTDSTAVGVNSSGNVAGSFTAVNGETRGFRIDNNVFSDLFSAAGIVDVAGINDSNRILGAIEAPYEDMWVMEQAALYHDGTLTNISHGADPTDSAPIAINNAGQAVFFQHICGDCENSFLYSGGVLQYIVWLAARDLNDLGHLVGFRSSFTWDRDDEGILYRDGTETVLAVTPGTDCYPQAINNSGEVVGINLYNDANHAFLYANGVMQDLNSLLPAGSGWKLLEATDINDKGQIIGSGRFKGEWHAYLLEPVKKAEGQKLQVEATAPQGGSEAMKAPARGEQP